MNTDSFEASVNEETGQLLRDGTPVDRIDINLPDLTAEIKMGDLLGERMVEVTMNGEAGLSKLSEFNRYYAGQDAVTVIRQFIEASQKAREERRVRVHTKRLAKEARQRRVQDTD